MSSAKITTIGFYNWMQSQNDDLFGTAVTVELNDGTTLFLTASDYFPNNVENSSLNSIFKISTHLF